MSTLAIHPRRFGLRPMTGSRLTSRPANTAIAASLALVTAVAVLGRAIAPADPIQPIAVFNLQPGTAGHLLGTDGIGRDLLSRTLYGIQASWLSALVIVAVGLVVGAVIGSVAGAAGGWVDSLLMRLTDLFLALPSTLVVIAIVAALGPSLRHTLIGISVFWWPYYARIVRGEVRALAARPTWRLRVSPGSGAPAGSCAICFRVPCPPWSSRQASTSATSSSCWPGCHFSAWDRWHRRPN